MDKKTKKIIAKEGLVFLSTIGLGSLLIWIGITFRPSLNDIFDKVAEDSFRYSSFPFGKMIYLGKFFIFLYPASFLIRFIGWSIKTLKQSN